MLPAEHPEAVAGRRVFDLATGSGLVAIAAARAGAAEVTGSRHRSVLGGGRGRERARERGAGRSSSAGTYSTKSRPTSTCCWRATPGTRARLAGRVLPWPRAWPTSGIEVLVGDPGRRYLPSDALERIATYPVRTTTELEDLALKQGFVYRLRGVVDT